MLSKAQIKYIQSLHHKKFREQTGSYIVEGPKICEEYLKDNSASIVGVYGFPSWYHSNEHLMLQVPLERRFEVEDHELRRLSTLVTPNEVLMEVKLPVSPESFEYAGSWTLALDGIQDPGNMGTLIRIADWFGISQILCSEDCADVYNPKVVQSSMGGLLRTQVLYGELREMLHTTTPVPLFAAMLEGEDAYGLERTTEGILLIGNESRGVRKNTIQRVYVPVTIPGKGQAESLNAAVACGILCSHLIQL
jgi:RNA methyltransferase, TrmH family